MVQYDSYLAIGLSEKSPGLVNSCDSSTLIGKVDIAHGIGKHAVELNYLISHLAGFPRLDCKTFVVWIVRITPHKISQGTYFGGSKSVWNRGEGRFEGNGAILIGVGLVKHLIGRSFGLGESTAPIGVADRQKPSAPGLLSQQHLRLSDICVHAERLPGLKSTAGKWSGQDQSGGEWSPHDDTCDPLAQSHHSELDYHQVKY